jgi:NAD+ kinase
MRPVNSFGIVAFKNTKIVQQTLGRIMEWARREAVAVLFHPRLKEHITDTAMLCDSEEQLLARSEALVSLGGDGTFLSVAHMSNFTGKPVIGVNLGSLGFLTDIGLDDLEDSLQKIRIGDYRTISRMVLEAAVFRQKEKIASYLALNDIFINRINTPKLTSISAWYGNDFITDFYADGIIVATPSGSTAYSLSAGGPIVDPNVKAFLITPICPHSLTERPIILPSDRIIRLVINEKNPDLLLSADGLESMRLQNGDQIVISYGGIRTNLIQLTERSYFALLRRKLGWGQGYKQRSDPDAA